MLEALKEGIKAKKLRHVAIIMDGNGRWAKERGLLRLEGHKCGAQVARAITTAARELSLEYLTLYSFSRQNWQRPELEISGLMQLLEEYCTKEQDSLMENDIRVQIIGELSKLLPSTQEAISRLLTLTANNRSMVLTLALDYGGREELTAAFKGVAADLLQGKVNLLEITPELLEKYLYTHELPDPDLLIRTSGEMRISNFLLWQIAYTELYFTPILWPNFTKQDFYEALLAYTKRERRFGTLG